MSISPIQDLYDDPDFDGMSPDGLHEAADEEEASYLGLDDQLEECTCGSCPLCNDDGESL